MNLERRMDNFNVLAMANILLPMHHYVYYRFKCIRVNDYGYEVSEFHDPVLRMGGIEPIKTRQYKSMGLDFTRHYIKIYDSEILDTLTRSDNPDEIEFKGYRYQLIHDMDWFDLNGWNSVLAVRMNKR